MGLQIKICGITRAADADAAVTAGADALGFMFYEKSPRFIQATLARDLIRGLPKTVRKVGVFVNPSSCLVWETVELTGVDTLQFHGDESPEFCRSFQMPVLKAFRIKDEASLQALAGYDQETLLLDSFSAGALGGTGARFNWDLAVKARMLGHRFYLAGGLTPDNVGDAVRTVQPFGVDVSSGVESAPGLKDPDKIRQFIHAAREVPCGK